MIRSTNIYFFLTVQYLGISADTAAQSKTFYEAKQAMVQTHAYTCGTTTHEKMT